MADDSYDSDWQHAVYMPGLDSELKCIVAVPFNRLAFKRLAVLQAEARALRW